MITTKQTLIRTRSFTIMPQPPFIRRKSWYYRREMSISLSENMLSLPRPPENAAFLDGPLPIVIVVLRKFFLARMNMESSDLDAPPGTEGYLAIAPELYFLSC